MDSNNSSPQMFACPNCKTETKSGSKFCIHCGHSFTSSGVAAGENAKHLLLTEQQITLSRQQIKLLQKIKGYIQYFVVLSAIGIAAGVIFGLFMLYSFVTS